ncbi:MAG TPA: hypothetical protein VLA77_02765 [Candidatus Saccharimonadales bacterium]|nr:hypothetical protein [Candidatus Saccharimonadales bacterium]
MRKHVIGVLILLSATLIAIIALINVTGFNKPEPQSSISINGEIVCLPHKNSGGPTTLECAFGLLADDGRYYGLRNYDATTYTTSDQVRVQGILKPETSEVYDISGIIEVVQIDQN